MTPATGQAPFSIVAASSFVRATRDSGYKGTPSAVAELVDNALQAGAQRIDIDVVDTGRDARFPLELSVLDDGAGMDPFTLRTALRFGGSSRFNDRQGLGRYGMGLPNSSFSQATCVSVYSWRSPSEIFHTSLDLERVADGALGEVPAPQRASHPRAGRSPSGTLILWTGCDRLDNKRPATVARKLARDLGRRFRYFIWEGVEIVVGGARVQAVDPLFLHPRAERHGATLFDQPLKFEIEANVDSGAHVSGIVTARFSELPVHDWHKLSNAEKRLWGISKGAGVSVVRAGREVDHGWLFMGAKRRENYDDWWRCEVSFEPALDELFGITHTKQQVRPHAALTEAITPELEHIAKALNRRARGAHAKLKRARRADPAAQIATRVERALPPLPTSANSKLMAQVDARLPGEAAEATFAVVPLAVEDDALFHVARDERRLIVALNPDHPFYRRVYHPLVDGGEATRAIREALDLTLLSAARAEAAAADDDVAAVARFRRAWGDTLAAYLTW